MKIPARIERQSDGTYLIILFKNCIIRPKDRNFSSYHEAFQTVINCDFLEINQERKTKCQ